MNKKGREIAVVGVGYSNVYRGPSPSVEALTTTACLAAIEDSGLTAKDIDGIFEYQIGNESPKALYVQGALGCADLAAYADIMGTGPSGLAGVLAAIAAVSAGTCETALAYRSIEQNAGNTGTAQTMVSMAGSSPLHDEMVNPFGMFGVIPSIAMRMKRRQKEYGGREEDYGLIALNARVWASQNERAVQRNLLTMDDYLQSKVLCEPLRLLDCDYPVSGSCAVIITTLERARDLRQKPVVVSGHSYGTGSGDWLHGDDFLYGGKINCAKRLWDRSGMTPADMDVAQLYDGFTYVTLTWLEALGFCPLGEAGRWLDNGRTIGPGGSLPMNTNGGQLAEGRLHGVSFLAEAVQQLRGLNGSRQVHGAKNAVVATSTGPQCGAMILTNQT
ncbi:MULTISPECIES: thiolase family protein [unclassified Pseudomonas]|uniref:thiolase family protein n=1 Tax=unclassified Pseudomonas TaxID=196821 RepID=UPI0039B787A8